MEMKTLIVFYTFLWCCEGYKTLTIPSTARSLHGDTVYTVYTDGRSWKEARSICRLTDEHLITFKTAETARRAKDAMSHAGLTISTLWIGLYWETSTSSKWDGPDCPTDHASLDGSYRFKAGVGDFSYHKDQRCYQLNNYELERDDCAKDAAFICETVKENKCNYTTSGLMSLRLGARASDVTECMTYCDHIEGCFMTSFDDFRCIFGFTSDVSNGTVAIKECHTEVFQNDDKVSGVTDDNSDPTDCVPASSTTPPKTSKFPEQQYASTSCLNWTITVSAVVTETKVDVVTETPVVDYSTITESVTMTDTLNNNFTITQTLNNNWTITETVNNNFTITETLNNNWTITETLNNNWTMTETVNNNWTITETLNNNWTITETMNNNWTITETVNNNWTMTETLNNNWTVTKTEYLNLTEIDKITETITVSENMPPVIEYKTSIVTETSIGVSTTTEFSVNSIIITEVLSLPVGSCVTMVTETPSCDITPSCSEVVTSSTMIASQTLYSQAEIEGTLGSDGKLRTQACQNVIIVTPDPEMTQEAVRSIVNELTINKANISALTKRKISIDDQRPSSVAIGYAGLAMLILPFLVILVIDLPTCILGLKNAYRTSKS